MTNFESNSSDEDHRLNLDGILQRAQMLDGDTTPVAELFDEYRQKLDALGDLLQKPATEPDTAFATARRLDSLQGDFRLLHLPALPIERRQMADLIDETVAVLEESPLPFQYKEKLIENAKDRSVKIRRGEA